MQNLKIYNMHVLDALKQIPDNSIDCIVTSPPYYGLRWYGNEADAIWGGKPDCEHDFSVKHISKRGQSDKATTRSKIEGLEIEADTAFCVKCGARKGQLGLEPDYRIYLDHLMQITAELKRVLKPTGTMWWNMGDSYNGTSKADKKIVNYLKQGEVIKLGSSNMPSKCLMQIPARFAMRMVDEQGWVLRDDVCWFKPNHMPSSVKDRLSNSWEHIYLFTKSKKYFFNLDAIREPVNSEPKPFNIRVRDAQKGRLSAKYGDLYIASDKEIANYDEKHYKTKIETALERHGSYEDPLHTKPLYPLGKNPGDVWKISPMQQRRTLSWANNYHDKGHDKKYKYNGDDFWTLTTKPYSGAHFATFPPELPERCIKAGGPNEVCSACGKPKEPISKKTPTNIRPHPLFKGKVKDAVNGENSLYQVTGFHRTGIQFEWIHEIISYKPTCTCNAPFKPGVVLDPFAGSGTTLAVALQLGRNAIGIEINPNYIKLIEKRTNAIERSKLGALEYELIKV